MNTRSFAGKRRLADLAVCGGSQAFSRKLHVNQPVSGRKDVFLALIEGIFERRWYSNDGPLVRELEDRICQFLHVDHCVLTCNGTLALAVLSKALELTGEVIVPSYTFVSTPHVLRWEGITPVFCDIDDATWNIDPKQCESLLSDRTSAIIGTHVWGRACDVDALERIARQRDIPLIFDAAHAFGCSHKDRMIGCYGTAEVLSFHATKAFHTFEGGAVVTNNGPLAARIREIRNFGFTDYDRVDRLGINAKMHEVSAAMGLANLEALDQMFKDNRRVYEEYRRLLAGVNGIDLISYDAQARHNHHYIVLDVDAKRAGINRDDIVRVLHAENVIARRYFYPGVHRMEPYRSVYSQADQRLSVTNQVCARVLLLPGGGGIAASEVERVCELVTFLTENAKAIREHLEHAAI